MLMNMDTRMVRRSRRRICQEKAGYADIGRLGMATLGTNVI